MRNKLIGVLTALTITAAACSDSDEVVSPGEGGSLEVTSDPSGALVELDGSNSNKVTPATFWDLSGRHTIVVRKVSAENIAYGYRSTVEISGDSLHRIHGPLMFRCERTTPPTAANTCLLGATRNRDLGRLRIASQATGALMHRTGSGDGLLWPLGSSNSYAAVGMPLIGMLSGNDTVALGIYDWDHLAGRPEPTMTPPATNPSVFKQTTWVLPTPSVLLSTPTVRGIEVNEELTAAANSDVVFIKLTFRNITNRESYRAADPIVPNTGLTFTNVYIGFGMDVDIGDAVDDFITYEPGLDMVYGYDSNFQEATFTSGNVSTPALVGLRIMEKPANTTAILNGWPSVLNSTTSGDWTAATLSQRNGYGILSGLRSVAPDHEGVQIGYTPGTPNDYRISVSAGPVTLAPGQETSITIALIMAQPVAGEYTSGTAVAPGNPTVADRQIRRVAATLLDRARTATLP